MSSLLESINSPADLKRLRANELPALCAEIRRTLIETVTCNGGHLASNLGVVELTVTLHRVFDSPIDKIVWDVGHQAYVHKLLTGRRDRFTTIRQEGGLSGFPSREESEHDSFGAGHASTSVSAALGLAVARDLRRQSHHVVAVIGDGAITGGLAYEGLNNAGQLPRRLIVILNDNQMSISRNVGAIARYLSRLRTAPLYNQAKTATEHFLLQSPLRRLVLDLLRRIKNAGKGLLMPRLTAGRMLWEDLGFIYIGPVDGHDLGALEETLTRAKSLTRPVFIHVCTRKGKGYDPAELDAVRFHGIPPNGDSKRKAPTYTSVAGNCLVRIAEQDQRVVAITAAMPDGTGLTAFAQRFPERFFDVGIAEAHAVTFAAGLASQGLRPVVAIYSTFLQRAYDQIVHDVCAQNLPVTFALDRAGLVGEDGRTHHGVFDLSFLRHIPNLVVMAPADENELQHMLWTAIQWPGPAAVRYPRGTGFGVPMDNELRVLPTGRAVVLRDGKDGVLLALGRMVRAALEASFLLEREHGLSVGVVNLRFAKPLDEDLIVSLARSQPLLLTVEENALAGGIGGAVAELLHRRAVSSSRVRSLGVPDRFVDHAPTGRLLESLGLCPAGIARAFLEAHSDSLISTWSAEARQWLG